MVTAFGLHTPHSGNYKIGARLDSLAQSALAWRLRHLAASQSVYAITLTMYSMERRVWAIPRSLAATQGISFDFSSSGY